MMKKVLTSLLILILITMFFSLTVVNAENIALNFFKYSNVFCIEVTNDFSAGNFTKTSLEYRDDENLKEFQSGLGYILSDINSSNRTTNSYGYYKNYEDPVQLALWYYLYQHSSEARSFFGSSCKFGLTVMGSNGNYFNRVVCDESAKTIYRNGTINYYSGGAVIRSDYSYTK